jgi:hypothetical protein
MSLLLPVTLISSASTAETKLDASIFSYDGKDFVRTETTLVQDGQSAVGTKLDLIVRLQSLKKTPYMGPATVFVETTADYAPLIGQTAN